MKSSHGLNVESFVGSYRIDRLLVVVVSHQKLIKLLFSAQTIIIFASRAAVKDG